MMPKQELHQTKYPSIFYYTLKNGKKKYAIRVRYQDVNLNWCEKQKQGFETLALAREAKAKLEIELSENSNAVKNSKITFKEWYQIYFDLKSPSWSKTTMATKKCTYTTHLSAFDHHLLSNISKAEYQKFINKLLYEKGLKSGSVKEIHRRMMAIMNAAVDHEILSRNKLSKVEINKLEEPKQKHFDIDTLMKIDAVATEILSPVDRIWYTLMRIGWRRGEALGITLDAVTIVDQNTITVSVKNTRTPYEVYSAPKNASSYRTNVLTGEQAKTVLDGIKEVESIYQKNRKPFTSNSHLIVTKKANPASNQLPQYHLDRVGKRLNMHIHPHMLRHSFASHAIASNLSVVEVSNWIGHADVKMTLDTYAHSVEEARQSLINFANSNTPLNTPREKQKDDEK